MSAFPVNHLQGVRRDGGGRLVVAIVPGVRICEEEGWVEVEFGVG